MFIRIYLLSSLWSTREIIQMGFLPDLENNFIFLVSLVCYDMYCTVAVADHTLYLSASLAP